MKTRIDIYQFRNTIKQLRPDKFSYEGLTALFEYLEQCEQETNTELEFDPIALCCEFSEFEDWNEFEKEYSDFIVENDIQNIDDIANYTEVISIENSISFIIQDF